MKTNSILVFAVVCIIAVFATGCGANMFGSSFTHTTTAPGMNRTEIRNQGMGTTDTKITENYSGMGMGYGAYGYGAGPVVGLPGSYAAIPAAPQSYECIGANCNAIPYGENSIVQEQRKQHAAIQNLRDVARCQQGNCK